MCKLRMQLTVSVLLLMASKARGQNPVSRPAAAVSRPLARALNEITAWMPGMKEPIRRILNTEPAQSAQMYRTTQGLGSFFDQMQLGSSLDAVLQPLKNAGLFTDEQQAAFIKVLPQLVTESCFVDIATMVSSISLNTTNIADMWALEMLDASGKPGPSVFRGNTKFMGNYKQCREVQHENSFGRPDIEGHICRAYLAFNIGPIRFGAGGVLGPPLEWDLCLPKSCKGPELRKFFSDLKVTQVQYMVCTAEDLSVTDEEGAVVAICVLAVFGVLVVMGTVMDIYVQLRKAPVQAELACVPSPHVYLNKAMEMKEKDVEHNNIYENAITMSQGYPSYSKTILEPQTNGHVTSASKPLPSAPGVDSVDKDGPYTDISLVESQNGDVVKTEDKLEIKKPSKPNDESDLLLWQRALLCFSLPRNTGRILSVEAPRGTIGCLHGIRVLSLAWVVLGHVFVFEAMYGGVMNKMDVFALEATWSFQIVVNAVLAVDTFFFMSGFLTAFLFMKECAKKKMVSLKTMVLYYVHRYWRLTPPMMVWIMIVATLMKYVGQGRPAWTDYSAAEVCRKDWWVNMLYINNVLDDRRLCVGVTWFLAHDMMYYIIAPFALVPFVYGLNAVGTLVSLLFISIHIASCTWLEVEYDGMDTFRDSDNYNNKIYFKPWGRIAPFAIGLLFGIAMYKSNGKIKMNKCVVALGWLLALGLCLILTLVTYYDNQNLATIQQGEWSKEARSAWVVLQRPLWALVIGWIVVACSSGYGGFINSILSWHGWLPLSRLSYGAYLTHMTLINFETQGQEFNMLYTLDLLIYKFLGFYVLSNAVGYLLSVFVEMPLLGLEKALLK